MQTVTIQVHAVNNGYLFIWGCFKQASSTRGHSPLCNFRPPKYTQH